MTEDVATVGQTSLRALTLEDRMREFDSQFGTTERPEGSFCAAEYARVRGIAWMSAKKRILAGIKSGQIKAVGKFGFKCEDGKTLSLMHYRF
jgi:hypothetical protein